MISLLVPSRGRPDALAALWASATETASGPIELVARLDEDDPMLEKYEVHMGEGCVKFQDLKGTVGPRDVLSKYWNECAERARFPVMMHCGDDIRFRTAEWDKHVLTAFDSYPDKIVFVHGRDGVHDANLGTHGFLHRRWIDTVGYFVPPYFSSDYNDLWLTEVANMIGRRHFIPAVYTEHMHPAIGKGEWDITHQERLERHRRDNVDAIYADLAHERDDWAAKLRAVMQDG